MDQQSQFTVDDGEVVRDADIGQNPSRSGPLYQDHLPARLDGLSSAEQEAMFDRMAETLLDEADQLAPEVRAPASPNDNGPLRQQRRTDLPRSADGRGRRRRRLSASPDTM